MYLNFGNGIIAGGTSRDPVRITDFVGLDIPIADVSFEEHGILDGGRHVATRIRSRVMAVTMTTTAYSRHEIAQAFRYGRLLTLSSELGSMPYYVEGLVFESPNQRVAARFTVSMRSPDAYPIREMQVATAGSTAAMEYPHEWPHVYDTMEAVSSLPVVISSGALPAEPKITLTAASTGDLAITHCGGVFTVAVTGGDVVVIDAARRTVTIDGTLAMTTFDRASTWPILCSGSNTLSFSQSVAVTVEFAVRVIGLI